MQQKNLTIHSLLNMLVFKKKKSLNFSSPLRMTRKLKAALTVEDPRI